jgi:hypothetical protein
MNTITKQEVVVQSDCTCTNMDETPSDSCYGCYDDAVDNLKYLITEWADAFGKDFANVRIDGTGMGWQRESGYAMAPLYRVAEALTIRGDFRITFTLEGKELTATRSSHDEPTGASFTFTPAE